MTPQEFDILVNEHELLSLPGWHKREDGLAVTSKTEESEIERLKQDLEDLQETADCYYKDLQDANSEINRWLNLEKG